MRFLILAILVLSCGVAQQRPDFSGTWKMDMSRSESAHQDVPIEQVTLIIHQTAADVSIETGRSGASTERLVFQLDGTERKNLADSGKYVKAKAHWDGQKLVTETEREINDSTVTTHQVFSLSTSGREVTIDKTLNIQHGYQSPDAQKTTGKGRDVFIKVAK